jgi:hypothetical protein
MIVAKTITISMRTNWPKHFTLLAAVCKLLRADFERIMRNWLPESPDWLEPIPALEDIRTLRSPRWQFDQIAGKSRPALSWPNIKEIRIQIFDRVIPIWKTDPKSLEST